jgi:nucleoside phosphorylase
VLYLLSLFLVLLCALWAVVNLGLVLLHSCREIVRMLRGQQDSASRRARDNLRHENWSIALLRAERAGDVQLLLDEAVARVRSLRARAWAAQPKDPVLPHQPAADISVLFLDSAAASSLVLEVARRSSSVTPLRVPGISAAHRQGPPDQLLKTKQIFDGAGLMIVGTVVCLLVLSVFLASAERASCRRTSCAGHATSFPDALVWLAYRMIFSSPNGISATSPFARYLGLVFPLLALTLAGVLIVTARQWTKGSRELAQEAAAAVADGLSPRHHLLIVVAATVERKAVMREMHKLTGIPSKRFFRGNQTIRDLGVSGSTQIWLAQSEQGVADPGSITLLAQDLIRSLRPDYVICAGICYGLKRGEQTIGDILVSTHLRVMDWRKVTAREDGTDLEIIRGARVPPSVVLRDRCRAAEDDWHGAELHFGLMLSTNTLVNSPRITEYLLDQEPDAIGGEMEGAGLYAAAAREKADWIVIKAISDWGVGKEDGDQRLAAESAAAFVAHLVAIGSLETPGLSPRVGSTDQSAPEAAGGSRDGGRSRSGTE